MVDKISDNKGITPKARLIGAYLFDKVENDSGAYPGQNS